MLAMRQLEPVEEETSAESFEVVDSGWNICKGVMIFGVLLTVIALGFAAFLFQHRPMSSVVVHSREEIAKDHKVLTPRILFEVWQIKKMSGLDARLKQEHPDYPKWVFRYRLWMAVFLSLAFIGIVAVIAALCLERSLGLAAKQKE